MFLITAGSFRRSQGLKSSSINPRTEEGQARYVVEILKLGIFFHHKTVGSDYFEALSVFSISVDVSPQTVEKTPPSSSGTTKLKYLFEAVIIILPVKCVFTLVKFTDSVLLPSV